MSIGVVIFLELNLIDQARFITLHKLNQLVYEFNKFDLVFLSGLVLLFGLLVGQFVSFGLIDRYFSLL